MAIKMGDRVRIKSTGKTGTVRGPEAAIERGGFVAEYYINLDGTFWTYKEFVSASDVEPL